MDISDDEGGSSWRSDSLTSVLTSGEDTLTSDGSGPSRGPKRLCADHDNAAVRVWPGVQRRGLQVNAAFRGVSPRTTMQPLSLDSDGDACLSSEGFLMSDGDEVPGVSPRANSPGSAAGPALRPAPRPLGCGQVALPAFGWTRGQEINALRPPRLSTCPSLDIVLKPGRPRPNC